MRCIYVGQWKSGLPHGVGRFYFDDGVVYEGITH